MTGGISKQNIEGATWLLLTAYSKMTENRNNLKTEFIIKRETEFRDLKDSQPGQVVENEKSIFRGGNQGCGQARACEISCD